LRVPAAAGQRVLPISSFVYLGIYWNNHHHLLQAIEHVDGRVLWANLHFLWLPISSWPAP
jgi:uncharacterized membrane protein